MAEDLENMNGNPEEDEEMELIELIDEDGETQTFELLAAFDLNDAHYLAVSEPIEDEDVESVEVFILKTVTDEEGNDSYVTVEEDESDVAFQHFLTLVEAEEE